MLIREVLKRHILNVILLNLEFLLRNLRIKYKTT